MNNGFLELEYNFKIKTCMLEAKVKCVWWYRMCIAQMPMCLFTNKPYLHVRKCTHVYANLMGF